MKLGTENRSKTIGAVVAGLLALIALGYMYEEFFGGPSPTPVTQAAAPTPAPARTTNSSAKSVEVSASKLDPTLHMEAMLVSESLQYSGTGRNIFSPQSAPSIAIPQPKASARPIAQAGIVHPAHQGPPPPPAIDLKLFGIETAQDGRREGCFLHDEDVYCVGPGGMMMRRYKVLSIDAKSALIEDTMNSDRHTLPLLTN